ncbi:SH3 domain-containing protein [Candidatus Ruminimicrobium bovinum]|uniref:SH3 domain-containing protein n=1 Tax=Candidatus Ruminimicrobium bovinum TaxID=3242779 RepID=UPI0039B8C14F
MKNFILIFFFIAFFTNFGFTKNINNTGICYDKVKISKKTKILNPTEIFYTDYKEHLTFKKKNPKEFNSAGFWISKLPNPDKVIFKNSDIASINKKTLNPRFGTTNLLSFSEYFDKTRLTKILRNRLSWITGLKKIFDENGNTVKKKIFEDIHRTIDLSKEAYPVMYAITTKYCEVRVLPTDIPAYSSVNSTEIDRLQEESIDMGTPVAVLCQTKDKKWSYAFSRNQDGWVKTENLAFTTKKIISKWISNKNVTVAVLPKVDVFLKKDMTNYHCYIRMGAQLPFVSKIKKDRVCVAVPCADKRGNLVLKKGFMFLSSINKGYLECTQRNILTLAFRHLNSPYGWGGFNGEQDCSGYLGQIFNCFGIFLPETSVQKIKCGEGFSLENYTDLKLKEKCITENAVAGLSFLYFPGHIMLYIGKDNEKAYIIHAVWGISKYNRDNEMTTLYINRIIVSDLELGGDVTSNSFIERMTKFNIIKN